MPPSKAEKRGLTLEKLASYDDVITDALVDKVGYYTSSTRQQVRVHLQNC
jgi:histone-lysine N-methyltransferase SUV420H